MKLHLQGYLSFNNDFPFLDNVNIIDAIGNFADKMKKSELYDLTRGLGGDGIKIPNCNLTLFFSNKKCSIEEAILMREVFVFGGEYNSEVSYEGYSEYTITTLLLDEFRIGGHNLLEELSCQIGRYVHFILESYNSKYNLKVIEIPIIEKWIVLDETLDLKYKSSDILEILYNLEIGAICSLDFGLYNYLQKKDWIIYEKKGYKSNQDCNTKYQCQIKISKLCEFQIFAEEIRKMI